MDSETLVTYQEWKGETVVSLSVRPASGDEPRTVFFLARSGAVEVMNRRGRNGERVWDAEANGDNHGEMRAIAIIGNTAFVCGYGGQLYRRDNGVWTSIDGGLREEARRLLEEELGVGAFAEAGLPKENRAIDLLRQAANLDAVGGVTPDDVYTVGLNGLIVHYDGQVTRRLRTATGANLYGLHCVSHDRVIAVGAKQTILIGNTREGFRVMHVGDDTNLFSVRDFRGDIYVGTTQGLHRMNGRRLEIVRDIAAKLDETTIVQQIDAVDDECLWVVSDRAIFRFDGEKAARFSIPGND